jgi:hypothetical protein
MQTRDGNILSKCGCSVVILAKNMQNEGTPMGLQFTFSFIDLAAKRGFGTTYRASGTRRTLRQCFGMPVIVIVAITAMGTIIAVSWCLRTLVRSCCFGGYPQSHTSGRDALVKLRDKSEGWLLADPCITKSSQQNVSAYRVNSLSRLHAVRCSVQVHAKWLHAQANMQVRGTNKRRRYFFKYPQKQLKIWETDKCH